MGNRYAKDNRPWVKPVERIELDDSHAQRKIILIILLLVIALACFGYSISELLKTDKGWTTVSVNSGLADSCGDDFTLSYYLGNGESSATVERKAITLIYSEASVQAFKMFNADKDFDDVRSIHYINTHINQEIQVEPYLYESFKLIKESGNRNIYLGPIYQMYDEIFYMEESPLMDEFDPFRNEEVKELYGKIAAFAANPEMIDIELLADNKIMLKVSKEYQDFIKENELENLVDFFWMKNSFIIDYLSDALTSKGYTLGVISSFDGYISTLYDEEIYNKFTAFDLAKDGKIYEAFDFALSGKLNFVYYHSYPLADKEFVFSRKLSDGSYRFSYLSVEDGLQKAARSNLIVYSTQKSNARLLLDTLDYYLSDGFEMTQALTLKSDKIHSVYFDDFVAKYTDNNLQVDSLLDKDGVTFKAELIK